MQDRRRTMDRPPEADQGIEMQDRPPSLLKTGLARETQIMYQRPGPRIRKNLEAPRQKKILMAYENKPNCCVQLRDQVALRQKHLFRNSCCSICMMIFCVFLVSFFFWVSRQALVPKEFTSFKLEKLKHPLYQTAYLKPEEDIWYSDFDLTKQQAVELEPFMKFAAYTNIERRTGRKIRVNGKKVSEKEKGYDPATDLTGPASYIPMQCFSNVTYKYASPLFGLIKQNNQLEMDLWKQIQGIKENMKAIRTFMAEMEKFFEAAVGDEAEAEEEKEEEETKDENTFTVPEDLNQMAGGPAPNPHPVDMEKLGDFKFKEFDSEEALFSYVRQDGYGWDEDKPAICLAFKVTENEAKNKYELELYSRDTWPAMYQAIPRLDMEAAPVSNAPQILDYTRQAYNGMNLIQIFAANSILARKVSPEAEIIMMTVPFKIGPFIADSFPLIVVAFKSFFLLIIIVPVVFYFAYGLGREYEMKFQPLLFKNGLDGYNHFLSWFIKYTVISALVSLGYVAGLKPSIFARDDFGLIFIVTFLGIESLFSSVWLVRTLMGDARMAIFFNAFLLFFEYYYAYSVDQTAPPLTKSEKQFTALLPLAAIKLTIDTYGRFNVMKFPLTFDNWDTEVGNWSLMAGVEMYIFNFIFGLVICLLSSILTNMAKGCGKSCLTRSVKFENTNQGLIEIDGLQDRKGPSKDNAQFSFTVEKSQICCLIGSDSAQKTNLMEMLAGLKPCKGKILVKDGDFFARSKRPNLSEFLVYRSSEVILDEDLTADEHLNIFAHLRGSQKYQNTTVLCNRLLPEKTRVKHYSESQRQCLQTLIALCSENSRIVLLDEPTRGMGPVQRSELIKALWRYKKDRYLIIQSTDAELVNVLADSIGKVLSTGIETVSSREIDHKIASYKLIVEVLDGKPSDSLVRYLSKDCPDLTLEYHTDLLTYYILPNISKQILFQKATFLENNMNMLGLIDFEIVSLPAFEVAQRNIALPVIPSEVGDGFEDSFDDIDYSVKQRAVQILQEAAEEAQKSKKVDLRSSSLTKMNSKSPELKSNEQCEVTSNEDRYANRAATSPRPRPPTASAFEIVSSEGSRPVTPLIAAPLCIAEDPEMKEFLEIGTTKRPAYRRDYYYDFKKYRTKRTFGPLQCPAICRRQVREHWRNKCRCVCLFLIPAIFVFLIWHAVRYHKTVGSGSISLSPEILPHKQPLLVNSKTQIGGKDTKKWIEKIPMAAEAFETTYIDTTGDDNFYPFEDALYDFGIETANEQPWSLGAYQFYEMDEKRHKYKMLTYCNTTSPFSTGLFPQFMIESVLKTVLEDDDFEFKVKVTSLPVPKEISDKGNYLAFDDFVNTKIALTMSDILGFYARVTWEVASIVPAAWFMLNAYTLLMLVRERTSERKLFLESHGQSKFSYWLARYAHDIVFYLPISFMAIAMITMYEPEMKQASASIFLQPFAMLPFLYVVSFMFQNEMKAALSLLGYSITVQWILPYLTVFARLSAQAERAGDGLFHLGKLFPMQGAIQSMMFHSEILWALDRFRTVNEQGDGDKVQTEESHPDNAPADQFFMLCHIVLFWFILLVFIEWKLPCCCCFEMRRISDDQNFKFFEEQDVFDVEDAGESSEVAQILGEGQELQLRFHIKQKPRLQLAYLLENFRLRKPRVCCGLGFCCKQETLISELSAQVQAGSKYAIVADGAHGKSTILNTLTNRDSAYVASGIIRRQIGRRTAIYTSQSFNVLLDELTLAENIAHFVSLGSVHPRLAHQMIAAFGLLPRTSLMCGDLNTSEKHLVMLIIALAGSNRTVILDEPFTALTHDQTIKLIKIIRQKYDCTLIVTAKTKASLELLQPQSILTIRDQNLPIEELEEPSYLLAVRLKPPAKRNDPGLGDDPDALLDVQQSGNSGTSLQEGINCLTGQQLQQFIAQNFAVFEKLRGKKRSLVSQVITKLMVRAKMSPEISQEIAEMVHEDIEMQASSQEMALKCELIMSLYALIEALCKRFGEVHLELRQDDYAVLRVVFNEQYRMKGIDDSFSDQNPVFSSVVEFVNQNETVRESTSSCHFMSARNATKPSNGRDGGSYQVKIFNYSQRTRCIQRARGAQSEMQSGHLQNWLWMSPSERQRSSDKKPQSERQSVSPFKYNDSNAIMTPKRKFKSPSSRRSIIDSSA